VSFARMAMKLVRHFVIDQYKRETCFLKPYGELNEILRSNPRDRDIKCGYCLVCGCGDAIAVNSAKNAGVIFIYLPVF